MAKLRTRNAERSRAAILDAATELFAARGFAATSVSDIAKLAGVARGTPNYFFESKEKLFKEVFQRENEKGLHVVPTALAKMAEGASERDVLDTLTDSYLDFLNANPSFFRLVRWASLEEHHLVDEVKAHWQGIADALQAAQVLLKSSSIPGEPAQFVFTIIGICTSHMAYGETLGAPLGVKPHDPKFLTERKRHVKSVVRALLEAR